MTVFLWDHKLTYVSVPKVACTSLKHMFFEIENGRHFERFTANGKLHHIHNAVYPGYVFDRLPHADIADHVRLTVAREPVRRFLSCYGNRVVHHKDLAPNRIKPRFKKLGATPNPSLDEFIEKFDLYREASGVIRRHSMPLVDIIGRDPSYYENIYSIENLDAFRLRVQEVVGRSLEIPRLQTGGPKLSPDDLGSAARRRIEEFYAEDYEIYGAYF